VYVTDDAGIRTYALPSGRLLGRRRAPAGIYEIHPSPDDRHFAVASLRTTKDEFFLVPAGAGPVRRITVPRMRLLGWLGEDALAIRADRRLRVLDRALRERAVEEFRPTEALIDGDRVLAVDGTALIAVRPGAGPPEVLGRVPAGTRLHGTL